jgi:RimJ/RimL family protein N-acetyltransferase
MITRVPPDKTTLVLPGERINLVGLAERHMPPIVRWRNDPEIQKWFFYREPFTLQSQVAWYRRYLADSSDVSFAIELKSGRTIGMIGLYSIDVVSGSAEFGRMMIGDADFRRHGYASEAAKLCLEFAEEILGVRWISLVVNAANRQALILYYRLGFVEVRRYSKDASDGSRHDALELRCELSPRLRERG